MRRLISPLAPRAGLALVTAACARRGPLRCGRPAGRPATTPVLTVRCALGTELHRGLPVAADERDRRIGSFPGPRERSGHHAPRPVDRDDPRRGRGSPVTADGGRALRRERAGTSACAPCRRRPVDLRRWLRGSAVTARTRTARDREGSPRCGPRKRIRRARHRRPGPRSRRSPARSARGRCLSRRARSERRCGSRPSVAAFDARRRRESVPRPTGAG